jgi:putative sigma-54 modulation protein
MDFNITARNVELTPEVKRYVERKLAKFGRQAGNIMEIRVEISEESTRSAQDRFSVRAVIKGTGPTIYGEDRGETIMAAADKTASIIKRQLGHQKGKLQEKGAATIRTELADTVQPEEKSGVINSVKSMEVKPMSLEEAREQIQLLGYDYLLFHNTDTRSVNLLIRQEDGNFELVQSRPG